LVVEGKWVNKKIKAIVCGDFNVDYMENSHKKNKFEDILNSYNLRSIITFPTRVGPNSSTIIDNIL
jgi:hypothetical protein